MYFHYQFVPEPYTCVEGVKKLEAAHYMTVSIEDFSVSIKKYWDFKDVEPLVGDTSELIRESFDELSRIIIRADVPVGISLSGGIDSGAIAVYASKHYREHMHVFSVGYPGRPANDEREMAGKLAEKMGLTYHDVELRTEDLVSSFPNLVYLMDDPIADIAAFGYYSVSRLAREHGVPVLLGGLGGDELFWGYEWVRNAVRKSLLKRDVFSGAKKGYNHLLSGILWAYGTVGKKRMLFEPSKSIKRILAAIEMERIKFTENADRFVFYDEEANFMNSSGPLSYLYTDEFKRRTNSEALYSFFTDEDWSNVPVKICKFLFSTWLYSNGVALGDRMSMANSVENRLPFLDYRFVELVMGLRKSYEDYRLGYKKWFIDAMKDIVPQEVLGRKKMGFAPPVVEWCKAIVGRYGELSCEGFLVLSGAMRSDRLTEFIRDKSDFGGSLSLAYKIVLFDMWYRRIVRDETLSH
jgi:asparagine synthase (glutamine-hydrolysing)